MQHTLTQPGHPQCVSAIKAALHHTSRFDGPSGWADAMALQMGSVTFSTSKSYEVNRHSTSPENAVNVTWCLAEAHG